MKNTTFCLLTYFIFFSCQNNQENPIHTIESFPINQELKSELVEIDSMPLCPKYMLIAGNYLLLLNYDNCDPAHFHVYDKNSFEYFGSFGTAGKGPNELIAPIPSRQVVANKTLTGFWIYNQKNKRHELVNIEKSLASNQCELENNHYHLPPSEGRGSSFSMDDDNIIVVSNDGEKGRFYRHNFKTKETQWFGFLPPLAYKNATLSDMDRSVLYGGSFGLSLDRKYFVAALSMAKRIDIFNHQLEHQVSIEYEDSPEAVTVPTEREDWHNTFSHFDHMQAGKDLIYVLNDKMSMSGRRTNDRPEVHVFTLQGKAVARYPLDINQRFSDFTVDEESNSIYCLLYTEDGFSKIIKYSISEI